MKQILLILMLTGFAFGINGQNLLYLDDTEVTIDNSTTINVEGGIVLQNQSRFDNDGTINVGTSGSGFTPTSANWVNNNGSEPGNNFVANGHVRLLLDGARITGTLGFPAQAYFNHLWLDAANGTNWMDVDINFSRGLHLGSSTFEVNNNSLSVGNVDPTVIDASGGGAIRLESGPPLPGAGEWSLIQWGTDSAPQMYSLPLRSASGIDYSFTFSTLASAFPQFVAVSSYGTPQNNQPLPVAFIGNPAVNDTDLDGNGSDDADKMVDRYWMIWSPNKALGTIEFQMPIDEASGPLNLTTPLKAFYFDGDWNFPGSGSGDATIGVTVPINATMIRTYALGNTTVSLPIECAEFVGTLERDNIHLEWFTLSETNNKGFELQRSTDGSSFETIQWLDGAGSSSSTQVYTFDDYRIRGNTTYYYRLIQVDFDGQSNESCSIISVATDDIIFADKPVLYPNPTHYEAFIRIPEELIGSTAILSDALGRKIKAFELTDVVSSVLRDELPSGTYFISIGGENFSGNDILKLIFIDE